jgi:Holliday junction resolvase RusA-like endonuclease
VTRKEFAARFGTRRQIFRNERSHHLPHVRPKPMSTDIEFFIPGIPCPGGSKRAFVLKRRDGSLVMRGDSGTPVINITDDAGARNKKWKQVCSFYGVQAMSGKLASTSALSVSFHFYMPRPKHHFGTGKNKEIVKADAPKFHIVKPDTTKLIRAVEDALTSICWMDDAQIVNQEAIKDYSDDGKTGCRIIITPPGVPRHCRAHEQAAQRRGRCRKNPC